MVSEHAQTVSNIFAMFLGGKSLNAIAKALTEVGIETAADGKWYPAIVGYILRDSQYANLLQ